MPHPFLDFRLKVPIGATLFGYALYIFMYLDREEGILASSVQTDIRRWVATMQSVAAGEVRRILGHFHFDMAKDFIENLPVLHILIVRWHHKWVKPLYFS
jgi:hypothetical protein